MTGFDLRTFGIRSELYATTIALADYWASPLEGPLQNQLNLIMKRPV